jgi:hypothetical protein
MTTAKESIEDTPRTNECEAIAYGYHDGFAFRFARQLERELNELQRIYDNHVDVCRGCNLMVRRLYPDNGKIFEETLDNGQTSAKVTS